jgi:hypothetical protein
VAASGHGDTPHPGKPVTSGSTSPYTTSVDVNLGPRQGLLSRTVDIGPELVATRVGMRPDAPECDRMQKMTTARRDCTHASNTQCPSDGLPRRERDLSRRSIWLTEARRLMRNPLLVSVSLGVFGMYKSWRHTLSDDRQRLLWPIERRFLSQTFHDGEAVAVRSYVRTGSRATR